MTDEGEAHALADQMLDWISGMQDAEGPSMISRSIARVRRQGDRGRAHQQTGVPLVSDAAPGRAAGRSATRERELTGSEPLTSFEPRPLDIVLSHWREAQLRLEVAPLGSAEAQRAATDIERLREEYQAGFVAQRG